MPALERTVVLPLLNGAHVKPMRGPKFAQSLMCICASYRTPGVIEKFLRSLMSSWR